MPREQSVKQKMDYVRLTNVELGIALPIGPVTAGNQFFLLQNIMEKVLANAAARGRQVKQMAFRGNLTVANAAAGFGILKFTPFVVDNLGNSQEFGPANGQPLAAGLSKPFSIILQNPNGMSDTNIMVLTPATAPNGNTQPGLFPFAELNIDLSNDATATEDMTLTAFGVEVWLL